MFIFLTQILAASLDPVLIAICLYLGFVFVETAARKHFPAIVIVMMCVAAGGIIGPVYSKLTPPSPTHLYDRFSPFDPDYRLSVDLQGSKYGKFAEWFVEANNADQAMLAKRWIDQYENDCRILLQANIFPNTRYGWESNCRKQSMLAKTGASVLILFLGSLFFYIRRRKVGSNFT